MSTTRTHSEPAPLDRSLSVRQLAKRWQVSPRTIRAMIRRRVLQAFDVGMTRKALRISPEAIRAAEQALAVKQPAPRRRHRADDGISPTVMKELGLTEDDL